MRVIPAIDLLGGRVVRLRAGRREEVSVYHDDVMAVARRFVAAGARELHIVDLDAAFGEPPQRAIVERVVREAGVPVQIGGGVRDAAAVASWVAAGAAHIVLGTAAVRDPALVERLCAEHPGRLTIAVDAKDGMVAVAGWTETTTVEASDLARRAAGWGAARILYTDVARDGGKEGPNVAATARLQAAIGATPVIASGGIGALDDLRALAAAGIPYCVVGRALYDGVFTVEEALAAC
jgi:phosphoribosylformimino-5-aminoimidazole carboxamide ribotide isomerase